MEAEQNIASVDTFSKNLLSTQTNAKTEEGSLVDEGREQFSTSGYDQGDGREDTLRGTTPSSLVHTRTSPASLSGATPVKAPSTPKPVNLAEKYSVCRIPSFKPDNDIPADSDDEDEDSLLNEQSTYEIQRIPSFNPKKAGTRNNEEQKMSTIAGNLDDTNTEEVKEDRSVALSSVAGQSMAGQSVAGRSVAGQSMADQSVSSRRWRTMHDGQSRGRSSSRGRSRSASRGRQRMQIYDKGEKKSKPKEPSESKVAKAIGGFLRTKSRSKSRSRSKSAARRQLGTPARGEASVVSKSRKQRLPPSGSASRRSVARSDMASEPGVIWVGSESTKRPESALNMMYDEGSMLSADSQEIYAMRQLTSAKSARSKSTIGASVVGASSVAAASVAAASMNKSMAKSEKSMSMKAGTVGQSTKKSSTIAMDNNTMFTSSKTNGLSYVEEFTEESVDSDDEMTMDTYANFTVEPTEQTFEDDDEDETILKVEEEDDPDDEDDDDESDLETKTFGLGFTSVAGGKSARTLKTNVSDVSGSFDDDEKLGNMDKAAEESVQEPAAIEAAKQRERKAALEAKKKKKRIFKMGTGLGKATVRETVKTEVTKKGTKNRKILGRSANMKTSKMKSTGVKLPKKKAVKKKRGVQLRTIRLTGDVDVDDIVPRKGDPGVKVMKVCKLTSQGYVNAEFTSIDPNNTPLHIACLTHYPTKFIIDHLIKADAKSNSVAVENSSGELPIHYAVMDKKEVDPDVFEALIEKFPEGIYHKNIDESLPIHVACQVGAPSLYSIKRLLELNPESATAQNDLQVPLDEDDEDEELEQEYQRGCHEMLCFDWGQDTNVNLVRYETGWTPLHLAAVNGAPPDVIEAIIEADIECLKIETNKGRNASECARGVVINAILNNVEIWKVQNTFNAIEVIQSYERELRIKEELALKSGVVNNALERVDTLGDWWMGMAKKLPTRDNVDEFLRRDRGDRFDDYDDYDYGDSDFGDEKGMTNMHRAVLKRAEPDVIHKLLEESPECMDIVSTYDRTPFECAKMVLIRGLLNEDPISTLTNTFVTFEMMQAYRDAKNEEVEFNATEALSKANANDLKTRDRQNWGSQADTYEYTQEFVDMNMSGASLLGNFVTADTDSAVQPFQFIPPPNLLHVNLRLNVPAGFRRIRKALLNQRADFTKIAVFGQRLKCKKIKVIPWSKHTKIMGNTKLKKGEKFEQFVGAQRTFSYLVPVSEMGGAHMVYETSEILEYNDFCFAIKSIIKTPDLPYGSEYETHCQMIVIDKGINNSRLICSSEMIVTGMPMEDDWQVRNSMRHRAISYFHAFADAIIMHAGSNIPKEKK